MLVGFETSSLCNLTFRSDLNPDVYSDEMADYCMQVMNGILANGMQNFIQYVTLFIRNVDNQLDIMINKGGYSKAYAQSTLDQLNFQ